jgi:hypothetical protein
MMPAVNVLLCGLAENPALPAELLDRLIAVADTDIADVLARRADLTHDQAVAPASRRARCPSRTEDTWPPPTSIR